MARVCVKSTDGMQLSSAVVTALPVSFAIRFKTTDFSATQNPLIFLSDSAADTTVGLWCRPDLGGTPVALRHTVAAAGVSLVSTSPMVTGTWHSVVATIPSASAHYLFFDDDAMVSSMTTVSTLSGLNRTTLGMLIRGSGTTYGNVTIEDATIWNSALTAEQAREYIGGRKGCDIAYDNLVSYYALRGATTVELDFIGSNNLTVNGTCAQAAGPSIYKRPTRRRTGDLVTRGL